MPVTVQVTTPLESVLESTGVGAEMTESDPVLDLLMASNVPGTMFPLESLTVAVSVLGVAPSATTVVGSAVKVDWSGSSGR